MDLYVEYGNSFPHIKTSPHGLTLIITQISEQNNMKKIYQLVSRYEPNHTCPTPIFADKCCRKL